MQFLLKGFHKQCTALKVVVPFQYKLGCFIHPVVTLLGRLICNPILSSAIKSSFMMPRGFNSITHFSIVIVSGGVILDCIIFRGVSNILPLSCI